MIERHGSDARAYCCAQLEDAGMTLMALRASAPGPHGYRSQWPDTVQCVWTAYAAQDARLSWPVPSADAIDRMDVVLTWLLAIDDPVCRRVVAVRMLTHPLSGRPIMSYGRIAKAHGVSRWTVKRWFEQGVDQIVRKVGGFFC